MTSFLEAIKLILAIKRNPEKDGKLKRSFENLIGATEVFVEATPSVLIQIAIYLHVRLRGDLGSSVNAIMTPPQRFGVDGHTIFAITFATSILSASFGLANSLKLGVCRTMGDGGTLDGLLSPRFLLAVLACGAALVTKGVMLGILYKQRLNYVKFF